MRGLLQRRLFVAMTVLPLAGCSEVVRWDEDALLNTGDTVTVHGERTYERGGAPGNPLQSSWYVKSGGSLSFEWKGQTYVFRAHPSPLLIAISPDGRPVIVAVASIGQWDEEHRFPCTTPHYVQFVPDDTRANWSWPRDLPKWLYGLPANLLIQKPRPGGSQTRFSADDVRTANAARAVNPYQKKVEPTYTADHCKTRRFWTVSPPTEQQMALLSLRIYGYATRAPWWGMPQPKFAHSTTASASKARAGANVTFTGHFLGGGFTA